MERLCRCLPGAHFTERDAPQDDGTRLGDDSPEHHAADSLDIRRRLPLIAEDRQTGRSTLVVVTDRNDLDNQLFGNFAAASDMLRETPVQADTRSELRRLLANRPSGGIIFTTIQKFTPGEDEDTFPVLSDRRNIVVKL